MIPLKGISIFLIVTAAGLAHTGAAAGDCAALVKNFERAVAKKSIDGVRRAAGDIAEDIVCGEAAEQFGAKYVAFLITLAEDPSTSLTEQKKALAAAEERTIISGTWKTAATIGDAYLRLGERASAFDWYERSLSFLKSRPGTPATLADKRALLLKASAAKSFENEDLPTQNQWLRSTRGLDGRIEGMYLSGLIREVEVLSVPLPVRFFTNESRLTPDGDAAVKELSDAANEQALKILKLVGHADPRGTAEHNLELSRRRVEAVRDRLKQLGVEAQIEVSWEGSQQPFDTSVLPYKPSQQEIWALDRRVEWVRGGAAD